MISINILHFIHITTLSTHWTAAFEDVDLQELACWFLAIGFIKTCLLLMNRLQFEPIRAIPHPNYLYYLLIEIAERLFPTVFISIGLIIIHYIHPRGNLLFRIVGWLFWKVAVVIFFAYIWYLLRHQRFTNTYTCFRYLALPRWGVLGALIMYTLFSFVRIYFSIKKPLISSIIPFLRPYSPGVDAFLVLSDLSITFLYFVYWYYYVK